MGIATLSNGIAVVKTNKLALGSSKITVVYSGNADFERQALPPRWGSGQKEAPCERAEEGWYHRYNRHRPDISRSNRLFAQLAGP